VVATFNSNPTDITYRDNLAAVVDANGSVSHVSIFNVAGDSNFNLKSSVTLNNTAYCDRPERRQLFQLLVACMSVLGGVRTPQYGALS
jgi:hypothetical protein